MNIHRNLFLALLFAFLSPCFVGCGAKGTPAGDYTVVPVKRHEDIDAKTGKVRALYLPSAGHHLVVASRTSECTERLKMANVGVEDGIATCTVGWSGDNVLLRSSGSKIPGLGHIGSLFVGEKGSGDYQILTFTAKDDTAAIAKKLHGRPIPFGPSAPGIILEGKDQDHPDVIEFFKQVSNGEISLWKLKREKGTDCRLLSTVPVEPSDSFGQRSRCAFYAWVLSDGKEGDALAELLLDSRSNTYGRGDWDLEGLISVDSHFHPQPGKIGEFMKFRGPATEERVEAEAKMIENIFVHLPKGFRFRMPKEKLGEIWGLPMRICFNRLSGGKPVLPLGSPLFKRLSESKVESLAGLMQKIKEKQTSD